MSESKMIPYNEEDEYYNNYHTSGYKMYCKEISQYPLLSLNEERKLLKSVHDNSNSQLLILKEIDDYEVKSLNINLLFKSLCNDSDYNNIIYLLIRYYSVYTFDDNYDYKQLKKYKEIADKLGRGLNEEELNKYFSLELNEEPLDKLSLLKEIQKFIEYKKSFDKIYLSNLLLVVSIANNYYGLAPILDIIEDGNLGLMKAIDRYDLTKGSKFSTYAFYWIRNGILRKLSKLKMNTDMSVETYRNIRKFKEKVCKLELECGHSLSDEEIASALNVSLKLVKNYRNCQMGTLYIDSKSIMVKHDTHIEDPLSNINQEYLKDIVKRLFKLLTPKEKRVIEMHYGFGEYQDNRKKIVEIAKILNVSHQAVDQLKAKALKKMIAFINNDKNDKKYSFREYIK